jgi:hypothetical protein
MYLAQKSLIQLKTDILDNYKGSKAYETRKNLNLDSYKGETWYQINNFK